MATASSAARFLRASCLALLWAWAAAKEAHESHEASNATAHGDGGGSGHHEEEHVHEYETLYVLFGFMLVGAAVLHASKLPWIQVVPGTVIFFVLGIGFAFVLVHEDVRGLKWLAHSYEAWVNVDPHLLLFTFLPPLLFSDAFAIDTHIGMRTFGQTLMLAGPGVVIGAFASAAFFYYALPYDWSFMTALTVGSILAATDPVAVVSLLKELGASPVLTMQIQGESMLNDGTAMVLFTMAYKFVSKEECDAACIVTYLLSSTLGAWLLGTVLGFLFFAWIKGASDKLWHTSSLVQIILTICCAYWSYLLADGLLGISGVLSTVAAASVLAHYMWPAVVHKEAMQEFWHVVESIGNLLVFFIAGLLVGKSLPEHDFADFLWAMVTWAMLLIVRLVTLVALKPIMNRVGEEQVTTADILVMTWGGLRGMVGLALAILVAEDRAGGALSVEDGDRVLFLVGMVAALTLVVNATTAPLLCGFLGITQTTEGRKALVRGVAKRAEDHVKAQLDGMIKKGELPQVCSITGVRTAVNGLTKRVKQRVFEEENGLDENYFRQHGTSTMRRMSSFSIGKESLTRYVSRPVAAPDVEALWERFDKAKFSASESQAQVTSFQFGCELPHIRQLLSVEALDGCQLKIVREVFLEVLRSSYWEQVQQGRFVSTREPKMLLNSASVARDRSGECLADWPIVERIIDLQSTSEESQRFGIHKSSSKIGDRDKSQKFNLQQWWKKRQLKQHLSRQRFALQVVSAFVKAHMQAQETIAAFFGRGKEIDTAEEAFVIVESQTEVYQASALLTKIAPAVQKHVCTAMYSYKVCERYCDYVHGVHHQGVLQAKEAEMLLEPAREAMQELAGDSRKIAQKVLRGSDHFWNEIEAAVVIQRAYRETRVRRAALAQRAQGSSASLAMSEETTLLPRARRQGVPVAISGNAAAFKRNEAGAPQHPTMEAEAMV